MSFTLIFFFNDTATTEIYTLSLHDALPICRGRPLLALRRPRPRCKHPGGAHGASAVPTHARPQRRGPDRKSTRLNSSHANISYAVFCLKKKTINSCKTVLLLSYFPHCPITF